MDFRGNVNRLLPLEQPEFGLKFLGTTTLHNCIVKLTFKQKDSDSEFHGNGFFVHVPRARKKFILTAGHNLVSKTKHTELKAHLSNGKVIDILEDDVRVAADWRQYPDERRAAQHDYGVILLRDNEDVPGDFGFSLPLSSEDRLDCELAITGYRNDASPYNSSSSLDPHLTAPVTSTGPCVNPILHDNQLEYLIETEEGISGSPVWLGYKKYPTVVAIHTYGQRIRSSYCGSKGTRINLKCLRDIFEWTGVDMTPKLLRATDPASKLVILPLRLVYWAQDSAFRVIVDEVDEPAETMLVSVFPVYAGPTGAKHIKPGYGFMQTRPDGWLRWLSWNPPPASTVSLVDDIRKAWLGRPEGKQWDSGEPFAIVTPLWPASVSEQRKDYMLVIDLTEINRKAKWRLEEPGEILNLIGYQRFWSNKKMQGPGYCRWVLESFSNKE